MSYFALHGRLYLIASNGAKKNDPIWVKNLRADTAAWVVVRRR